MKKFILASLLTLAFGPAFAQVVAPAPPVAAMVCANNTVVPTPTNGQFFYVQCDSTGKLITSGGGSSINFLSYAPSNVASNTTSYIGGAIIGSNQNVASIAPHNGTFKNLYLRTANAPGAGQTFTYTLYIGTAGSMTSTAVTCQIADTNQTCSDLTHSASITAGQSWAIQAVTSATSATTGQQQSGIELDTQ